MSEINEEIKQLRYLKDNVIKDIKLKQVINEVINFKEQNDNIENKMNDFIEKLDEELGKKSKHQDTKLLVDLYNNYVQNLYEPSDFQKHILHIANELEEQLEKIFNEEQIILVKQLNFCNLRMQDEIAEQAFVAGYAMCQQMKDESISKYNLK